MLTIMLFLLSFVNLAAPNLSGWRFDNQELTDGTQSEHNEKW